MTDTCGTSLLITINQKEMGGEIDVSPPILARDYKGLGRQTNMVGVVELTGGGYSSRLTTPKATNSLKSGTVSLLPIRDPKQEEEG